MTTVPDRMAGRLAQPWCPHCHGPAGPDCPDRSRSTRQVRRYLKRELAEDAAAALSDRKDDPA